MEWDQALYTLQAALSTKSESTQRNYYRFCENFRFWVAMPLSKVRPDDCQAFCNKAKSASTQNHCAAALTFFFRYVLNQPINLVKRSRRKEGKRVDANHSRRKINAMIRRTPHPIRAAACLIYGCGLKIGELKQLKRKDLTKDYVKLHNRKLAMPQKYWPDIQDHLSQHTEEQVFISSFYGSNGKPLSLSRSAIQKVLTIKPAELRHQFAKDHVKNGASVSDIQYMLGLVSTEAALRYFTAKPKPVILTSPADL